MDKLKTEEKEVKTQEVKIFICTHCGELRGFAADDPRNAKIEFCRECLQGRMVALVFNVAKQIFEAIIG